MNTLTTRTTGAVARPPRVLVPLIQKELAAGQQAGIAHFRHAGEMLIEAKGQIDKGGWYDWLEANFHLTRQTATGYMRLARDWDAQDDEMETAVSVRSIQRPDAPDKANWYRPVQAFVSTRVNVERLRQEEQGRAAEAKLVRDLCEQIITIGYKVLATKLHPDKRGGSSEAMARLNRARTKLRGAL